MPATHPDPDPGTSSGGGPMAPGASSPDASGAMSFDAGGGFAVDVADGIATVTFTRPPANTFADDTYVALGRVADDLAARDDVRVVVVASGIDGIFVAGGDIAGMATADRSPAGSAAKVDLVHDAFGRVERLPMPTIAAITGHAMGGGCELALCMDFRVMTRGRARIGLPETGLGLVPGGGGTQRLARLVGPGPATELVLLGRRLDADQAAAIGLVTAACDTPADVQAHVAALASDLAARAPLALRAAKRALAQGLDGDLASGLAVERDAVIAVRGSDDAREGVAAFLDRRPPTFTGQ